MNVFVMMPFSKEFNDVYEAIKISLSNSNIGIAQEINPIRLDDLQLSGRITKNLLTHINQSTIGIADITGNNPNVLWEVGYATALNKPLILITQNLNEIPFDIYDMKTIEYTRGNVISSLKEKIKEHVVEILRTYEFEQEPNLIADNISSSIAVTGSMNVDKNRCVRRLKSILPPFLGKNFSWYVGSYGTVDECVIEYLCKNNEQRILVVGYHEYDISPNILELVKDHKLPFIDPRREQIPAAISGTHHVRDAYMLVKSDLTILLWDGVSQGTKELINYYQKMKNDFIVGFC